MSKIEIDCTNCSKSFTKYDYQMSKSGNNFCTKSCANSFNNKLIPKRKIKEIKCKKCDKILIRETSKQRKTYCTECHPHFREYDKITFQEVKNKRFYQKHSRIRELARNKYFNKNKNPVCCNCGYSKHIEVCHIQAVKDHNDTDTIAYINRDENLISLCRNCHWELDNGILKI